MPKPNIELLGSFITEYSVKNRDGADIPVYSVSNDKGFCRDYFSKDVSSKDKTSYKIVPRGCFAYNPSRINVGSIAWQNKEDAVIVSPLYVVFSTKGLNNDFLMYYLKSNALMSYIKIYSAGSVRNNLRFKTLSSFPVKVPSLEQQARIVAELDCLTGIIEKKRQQLEELDKLAQSIFYDMFGDPITNEKGFPAQTIDDVIAFQGGSQPAKSFFQYEATEDNIRLIQTRDYRTDSYITYIPKSLARRFCNKDDIMIGRYGPPIFQIFKGLEGAYNVALMKAIPKKGNREFIRAFLQQKCLLHYLENFSQRVAGQDGIQMDKLKSYPFPYPPIDLQNEFAEKIEAIEKQKELVKQSIVETETLFNSRMDYWFN